MDSHITLQRSFFNSHKSREIDFRIAQLVKFKKLLKANEKLLFEATFTDFKKSAFDTYTTELSLVYQDIDHAIKNVNKWASKKYGHTNLINFPARSYVIPEPYGVCLVIGAWNYPYMLSLCPAVAALASGNTVILKPSELPKNTSAIIAKLINDNFDPGYFKVIEGGVPETTEILKQKFDKIFFSGSEQVGRIIYKSAAEQLTPVTLELGGKSPVIITKDCNLKMTTKRLIWGKFLNAGQTCIAPDYVLIHTSIKEQFLKIAKKEIEIQSFSFENENYAQIINKAGTERLVSMIEKDKVYCGGGYDLKERFIEPTILTDVKGTDEIMKKEIFGPILPVLEYNSIDEAISFVNSRPKPLSCYVFTKSSKIKNRILNQISFGGGAVNDTVMHVSNGNLPFGGIGNSGIGNYHSEYGFRTFSHYKGILDKPTWLETNLKYFPRTPFKLKLIKFLLGQK